VTEIHPAAVGDVPNIQRLARQAWQAAYGGFVTGQAIDEMLGEWYSDDALERAITAEGVVYLVAEEGGSAVGYASATESDDSGTAVLSSIYVAPDRWGEGVGTVLFEAVAGRLQARGLERVRATVLAENDVGRAFYDRRGFERVDARETELGGNSYDALVVERPLG
jgi:ribosomal protein S18 acetylase RimI-like enzyme